MWLYLLEDFSEILLYLPWALAAGCAVYLAARAVNAHFLHRLKNGKQRKRRASELKLPAALSALSVFYVVVVLGMVFFGREPGSRRTLSLLPFETFGDLRANLYVFENVLLFLPYGGLAACWMGVRGRQGQSKTGRFCLCIVSACLVSMAIELFQYLFARGFTQTDDVAANTLGAVLGYLAVNWYKSRRKT